ncbi:MAG: hypothetical protein RLZZ428_435 [Pseudomonadota bacterium]
MIWLWSIWGLIAFFAMVSVLWAEATNTSGGANGLMWLVVNIVVFLSACVVSLITWLFDTGSHAWSVMGYSTLILAMDVLIAKQIFAYVAKKRASK